MLNLITKSKIRQKIILLFIYNPGRSYYINEIARLIGTSAGNIQRELRKLQESGLLVKEKRGNLVYYKTDTASPLFSDFKSIIDKTIGLQKILKEELKKLKFVQFAFLFGSYVKGDFKSDSDIDLYAIGNVNEDKLYSGIRRVEEKIKREINYHFSTVKEFRGKLKKSFFHKEIVENYILIVGDANEFRKIIR